MWMSGGHIKPNSLISLKRYLFLPFSYTTLSLSFIHVMAQHFAHSHSVCVQHFGTEFWGVFLFMKQSNLFLSNKCSGCGGQAPGSMIAWEEVGTVKHINPLEELLFKKSSGPPSLLFSAVYYMHRLLPFHSWFFAFCCSIELLMRYMALPLRRTKNTKRSSLLLCSG